MPSRIRPHGYSLIEVLVTLCIVGVTVAVCAPLASDIGSSMKLSAVSNGLLADIHFARSEAIKRRNPVVLCKSSDGMNCTNSGGWEQGWIVFSDQDNNAVRGPGETVLQRLQALPRGFRVAGNPPVRQYVSFHPSGSTRTPTGAFQAGTITVCRDDSAQARVIVFNAAGRPRIQKVAATGCP